MEYLSFKPTDELVSFLKCASRLDVGGLSRDALFERAERFLYDNRKNIDFKSITQKKTRVCDVESAEIPSSMKIKILNPFLDQQISKVLLEAFELTKLRTTFKVRIVLLVYLKHLQSSEREKEKESISKLRLRAIEMILSSKVPEEKLQHVIELLNEDTDASNISHD